MPAMTYTLRWPDASECVCYSPSLIVRDTFAAGVDYPLPAFLQQLREVTAIASERVRAKYGFACSRAAEQLSEVEARAARFTAWPDAHVRVVAFDAP